MKWIGLFISLFFVRQMHSQKAVDEGRIVAIHPSVGNTIDVNEKKQYDLFPEYVDSTFESAELIKYNDSTYTFLVKTTKGKSFERPVKYEEMRADYNKIENVKPAGVTGKETDTDYYSQKSEEKEKARSRQENSAVAFEVFFDVLTFTMYLLKVFAK